MHQPSYGDPQRGEVVMPWVRLHGVKDYSDMGALLEGSRDVRVTFNWVPGLMDQLEQAADPDLGRRERFLRLTLTPTGDLDERDRAFIVDNFFSINDNLLRRWPRYVALRARAAAGEPLADDELRDLQVLFNLAWCGQAVLADPALAPLVARGEGFLEADKATVIEAHQRALAAIPARYRALAEAGTVELTCTPYYHPILPLLIDSDLARVADPGSPLPAARFRWPGDAAAHVRRAVEAHARRFGCAPRGMWPAEGSVAPPVVPLFRDAGVDWIVTDEAILEKGLGRGDLSPAERFCPWAIDGLRVFFRDHGLSDRVGFDYAGWPAERAWYDFVTRLEAIRDALEGADGVVTVALDGENCWEHYPSGCAGFLPGLYERIADTPGLRLSTLSEAADAVDARPLPQLGAGSWIDGTFRTWLGDPVKNRAWELLAAARAGVGRPFDEVEAADPELADVILRAEASDWWWWFGEGHTSSYDDEFDALFRSYLSEIHSRSGHAPPEALAHPLGRPGAAEGPVSRRPLRQLRPPIDGRRDWFFKWLSAGSVAPVYGAVHRAESRLEGLVYGNDDGSLSLRVDTEPSAREVLDGCGLALVVDTAGAVAALSLWPPEAGVGIEVVAGDVFEARMPLEALGAHVGVGAVRCRLELRDADGLLLERFPAMGWAELALVDARTSGGNQWV